MPKHIEVDHETESHYRVYTYDLVVTQTQEKPKAPNHQYLVDKESGEIVILGEKNTSKGMAHKDKMTYEIAAETLWMVDEQGSRGRLVNLEGLYSEQIGRAHV